MPNLVKDNGLSITMFAIFAATLIGLSVVGWQNYNEEQQDHEQPAIGFVDYLATPNFGEAVFENWESEFLQMGAYVLLTVFLFQRGSSESKDPDEREPSRRGSDDKDDRRQNAPWPVRRGGVALKLYENSLTIALFALFFMSFALHAVDRRGRVQRRAERARRGAGHGARVPGTSRFWFESLQNWQSEFLAVGTLIVLVDLPAAAGLA